MRKGGTSPPAEQGSKVTSHQVEMLWVHEERRDISLSLSLPQSRAQR